MTLTKILCVCVMHRNMNLFLFFSISIQTNLNALKNGDQGHDILPFSYVDWKSSYIQTAITMLKGLNAFLETYIVCIEGIGPKDVHPVWSEFNGRRCSLSVSVVLHCALCSCRHYTSSLRTLCRQWVNGSHFCTKYM